MSIVNGINNPIPEDWEHENDEILYPPRKKKKDYRYIGKPTPRIDARDIVTGKAIYLDDFSLPGMLYGRALRSPYANAIIKNINTEKARALPGVHAVLCYKDFPDKSFMFGVPPVKMLLDRHLRYAGDIVAIVAAETLDLCNEAIDLIEVDYEVLDAVFDIDQALADGAPVLYEDYPDNIFPGGLEAFQHDGLYWHLVRGDVDEGFKECKYVVESTAKFDKMCTPAPPEPPGAIVRWEGGNKYKVWGTIQSSFFMRATVSAILGGADVEERTFNVGGAYGNKQVCGMEIVPAALLSRATGKPVKFFEDKVDQMIGHEVRLGTKVTAKIGMDENGIVRAVKGMWYVDCGCYCNGAGGQVSVGLGETQLLLAKCKNWDIDSRQVVTNKQPAGVVRGYGGQELNSCLGILLGNAMRQGNFDPVEIYKKNYVSAGDVYIWRDGNPWKAHTVHYDAIFDAAAEKFGWKETWKGWGKPTWTSEDGRYVRGVGFACIGNADVGEDWNEVYVRLVPDIYGDGIKIVVHDDIAEIGQGQRSSMLKNVAEILNVPLERVEIIPTSSQYNPHAYILGGSCGTVTHGHALSSAAEDLRDQILKLAQPRFGVSLDALNFENGYVYSEARPGMRVHVKELTDPNVNLVGYGKHGSNFSTPNIFMNFVEVEVDKETGKASVIRMLGATDCGQVIDPLALEGQAQGGIGAASMDTALFEEHIYDQKLGRLMTYNMIEYKWRTFNDMPEHDHLFMESQFDSYQFHALGCGEITGATTAAAVLSAISDAIGTQIVEYPATPDVILKALGRV